MKNKIILSAVCVAICVVSFGVGLHVTKAFTSGSFNLLRDQDFVFHIVEMDNATGHETITLPTLNHNNGQVHIVKRTISESEFGVVVQPASGDKIDGLDNRDWSLGSKGDFVMLVADEDNDTWWVVGNGTTGTTFP